MEAQSTPSKSKRNARQPAEAKNIQVLPGLKMNRLAMMMRGIPVPDVLRDVPLTGKVSQLWNPYIGGNNRFSRKGVTGAEIAQLLCEHGCLQYWYDGKVIEPATPIDNQPNYEKVRLENPIFVFIGKPPTRDQFNSMLTEAAIERAAQMN